MLEDRREPSQHWPPYHSLLQKSLYTEVAQGVIFTVQIIRFGLILGRLSILKKNWPDYDQVLKADFSNFHGQKNIQNSVASSLKICILLFYRLFLWIFGGLKIG